ncbi:response regulator [Paraburkholderia sp. RL17-373-BIF-A]|uniref:response regulator n=1 Tax=Paraburkholderia sp. RL17-373-BIF-A TaxID=3031629 RepID=UPI0038BA1425
MVKVAISDAHPVLRCGVRSMLERDNEFEIVGECFDGASTIALIRSAEMRVLTLGMSMLGVHGISLIEQIKFEKPLVRVLVLTRYPEESYAIRALKAGASGFVAKTSPSVDLLDAVRKVASGGIYLSLTTTDLVAQILQADRATLPHQRLTDRELDVFVRIASGQAPKFIAHALSLSAKTISTYRAHIFEKTKFPHDAALVRYAVRHELIAKQDDTWAQ